MKASEPKELFSKLTLDQKIAQLLQVWYIVSDAREVVTEPLSKPELDEETSVHN